ncbi:nuclease [Aureococcus anophagefferens]|nr:nuclease [Aureococcus anophagefferens]
MAAILDTTRPIASATTLKEALMRAGAAMTSAKAGLMPADTTVQVLALETLENGTERAREWHDLATERGAGFEVAALEWTGHGGSRRCPGEGASETRYDLATVGRDDVLDVLDALRGPDAGRRAFAVAHSIGAQLCFHAEQHRPGAFAGLCCFEPMVYPAPPPAPRDAKGPSPFIKTTLKRRSAWPSDADAGLLQRHGVRQGEDAEWTATFVDASLARMSENLDS